MNDDKIIDIEFAKRAQAIKRKSRETGRKLREGWEEDLKARIQEERQRKQNTKRNTFIAGIVAAAGITAVGTGVVIKGGNDEPILPKEEPKIESETQTTEAETEVETYDLIESVLEEYKRRNPEIDISIDTVGIMKENTSKYVFEENGIYKENYKATNGNSWLDETRAKDIYTLLDKENQKVITALGDINFDLSYVEVQETRDPNNIPYYGNAEEMIELHPEDLVEFQEECENLLQERIEEKRQEKEDDGR